MKQLTLITLLLVSLIASIPVQAAPYRNPDIWQSERDIATERRFEIGVGITARGHEAWRIKGKTADTFLPTGSQWMMLGDGGGYSHQHIDEGHCVALSWSDVGIAAWYNMAFVRAVGYEAGKVYVYILRSPRHVYPLTKQAFDKALAKNSKYGWCGSWQATWKALGFDTEVIHD